jgi:hypothetical protein
MRGERTLEKEKENTVIERVNNVPFRLLFSSPDVRIMLDNDRFLDKRGVVLFYGEIAIPGITTDTRIRKDGARFIATDIFEIREIG